MYDNLPTQPALRSPARMARTYSWHEIPIEGIDVPRTFYTASIICPFNVISDERTPNLEERVAVQLGLNEHHKYPLGPPSTG